MQWKNIIHNGSHSPDNAKIKTITLNEDQASNLNFKSGESKSAYINSKNESSYKEFMFSGTSCESKIDFSFKNSMDLDIKDLKNKYDLIFIDGGHTYSIIKNDTEKVYYGFDAIKLQIRSNYTYSNDPYESKDLSVQIIETEIKRTNLDWNSYSSLMNYIRPIINLIKGLTFMSLSIIIRKDFLSGT